MVKVSRDTFRLCGFRLGSELLNNESITLEIMSEPKVISHEVCFTTTSISLVQTRLHVFTVNLKIVKSTLFKRVLTDVSAMLPSTGYKTKYPLKSSLTVFSLVP